MQTMGETGKAPAEHTFDLSGGALCLDFANTVGDRPSSTQEHLTGYADLLAWSRQAGVIDAAQARKLERRAARQKAEAKRVFDEAITLRECLYRIFSALAAGDRPKVSDIDALNRGLVIVFSHRTVVEGDDGFEWRWAGPATALDRPLWPVLDSAATLLTSGEVHRIRECHGDPCSWLFIDRSRAQRRRWCDMKVCGNRAKARRHYQRTKKSRSKRAAEGR